MSGYRCTPFPLETKSLPEAQDDSVGEEEEEEEIAKEEQIRFYFLRLCVNKDRGRGVGILSIVFSLLSAYPGRIFYQGTSLLVSPDAGHASRLHDAGHDSRLQQQDTLRGYTQSLCS